MRCKKHYCSDCGGELVAESDRFESCIFCGRRYLVIRLDKEEKSA